MRLRVVPGFSHVVSVTFLVDRCGTTEHKCPLVCPRKDVWTSSSLTILFPFPSCLTLICLILVCLAWAAGFGPLTHWHWHWHRRYCFFNYRYPLGLNLTIVQYRGHQRPKASRTRRQSRNQSGRGGRHCDRISPTKPILPGSCQLLVDYFFSRRGEKRELRRGKTDEDQQPHMHSRAVATLKFCHNWTRREASYPTLHFICHSPSPFFNNRN